MKCPNCAREIGYPPCTCVCGAVVVVCLTCKGGGCIVTEYRKGSEW